MRHQAKDEHHPSSLLLQPDKDGIRRFAQALKTEDYRLRDKSGHEVAKDSRLLREELQRLVHVWFESGRRVRRVFLLEPALAKTPFLFRAQVVPILGSTARIQLEDLPNNLSDPKAKALSLFVHFLLNPANERLGGPCATCRGYFYKETLRAKSVYCSPVCSHRGSSRMSNRDRRKDERADKVRRANELINGLRKSRIGKDWKALVNAMDPEISKNFLTRAERSGQIIAPTNPKRVGQKPTR